MKKFVCTVCGYTCEGEQAPDECPVCHQPGSKFREEANEETLDMREADGKTAEAMAEDGKETDEKEEGALEDLSYDKRFYRIDESCRYMEEIHQMAVTGKTIGGAMGTKMPMPSWDDILLLGAQLNPPPLDEEDPVNTMTVIGKHAKKPMVLENPVYVSHMSFGALSKEIKVALAKGSAMAKTAMCSGEGGILPEEREAAYKYIFEYIPNKYSVTDENLRRADAIEIKIGQGTKPGMGGHLPGEKVTEEIARLRGKNPGEDVQSPSKFPELNSREDLKDMVSMLRNRSDGRPIGIKIAAGRIERDLEYCVYAEPDFITIDGRGGATGSSPLFLREATTVPTIYALYRARKYLDDYRRLTHIRRCCKGSRHGRGCSSGSQRGSDSGRMPAVPDLRFGQLSCRHCHPESRTKGKAQGRAGGKTCGKLFKRNKGGIKDLCADHGPWKRS